MTDEAYSAAARPFPSMGMLLQPGFLFSTAFNFVRVWFVSRNYRLIAIGLPAIIIGLIVGGVALSGNRSGQANHYAQHYKRALVDALKADDLRGQEVALNSLLQLQPDKNEHRFQLALLRIRQKQIVNGLATMRSLANDKNYPRARLWLAQQLLGSPDQRRIVEAVGHLKEIVKLGKTNPEYVDANGMLGEIYLKLRQPSLAKPFLIEAAGTSPGARLKLADCLLQLGENSKAELMAKQAEVAFRDLVGDNVGGGDPQSAARVQWAECLRIQGRLQEAQSVLIQGLAVSDDDPLLRSAFGRLIAISASGERIRGASNVARYTELLVKALQYDPENMGIVTQLAELPLKPGDMNDETLATIKTQLNKRIEVRPDQVESQMLMAWVQRMEGDSATSVKTMQGVVAKQPELRLSLAQLHRLTGNAAQATVEAKKTLEYFKGLSETTPDNHVNYVRIAASHEFLGDSDAAIKILDEANESHPHPQLASRAIQFRLAQFDKLKRENKDRPEQFRIANSILEKSPVNAQAIRCLGALVQTSKNSKADEVTRQARKRLIDQVSNGKNQFQIYSMLGAIANEENDIEAARRNLTRAYEIQPEDPVVCNNLAHTLANLDDVKEADLKRALDLANRALKQMPGHPEVLETRGEIYVKFERFNEAQADLEACLGKSGDVRDVHRLLAIVFAALEDPERAARHKELSEQPDE